MKIALILTQWQAERRAIEAILGASASDTDSDEQMSKHIQRIGGLESDAAATRAVSLFDVRGKLDMAIHAASSALPNGDADLPDAWVLVRSAMDDLNALAALRAAA